MEISNLFKEVIKNTFYDKKIDIYGTIEEIGEELDTIMVKGELKEKDLLCNVHFIGNDVAKKDYGLDIEASIMVTCDKTVAQISDIITYLNQDYTITGILTLDSHTKIFAKLGGISG